MGWHLYVTICAVVGLGVVQAAAEGLLCQTPGLLSHTQLVSRHHARPALRRRWRMQRLWQADAERTERG